MALDFLAGCLGGCAGVLACHPFDTVKVHLQTQNAKNPIYNGTFDCFRKIIAKDKFQGLYRGMSSPIAGVAFVNAIVFGVYGNVQRNTTDPESLRSHFLAGSTAGLVQSVVCSPMELAKTRIQLQGNCPGAIQHKGPLQFLNFVRRKEGFRGVYCGFGITIARDVPGFATYFVSYEMLMNQFQNPTGFHTLMAGGLAGTFSWVVTIPIDVIKSSLQADGMSGARKYSGIIDCMRKGYQSEGCRFYTRGLVSTLLRAFPMNAACFLVVSWVMKLAEKVNLDVAIHPTELAMIGSSSSPVCYPSHYNSHQPSENYERIRRKSHFVKSLLFLGAFSEAVCHSEIVELANDLCHDKDKQNIDVYFTEMVENRKLLENRATNKLI